MSLGPTEILTGLVLLLAVGGFLYVVIRLATRGSRKP
jgi:hypothetical protein